MYIYLSTHLSSKIDLIENVFTFPDHTGGWQPTVVCFNVKIFEEKQNGNIAENSKALIDYLIDRMTMFCNIR